MKISVSSFVLSTNLLELGYVPNQKRRVMIPLSVIVTTVISLFFYTLNIIVNFLRSFWIVVTPNRSYTQSIIFILSHCFFMLFLV